MAGYVEPHGKDFTFCDVLERCGGLCVLCYACAAAAEHLFTRMARVLVLVVEVRITRGGQAESQWQGGCLQLRGRWMKMIQWFRWKWLAIFVLWRDWLKKCKCGRLWQHFDGVEKVPVTRVLGKHRQHWFMILKNDPVWLAKEVILLVIKDGGSVY